MAKCTVCMCFSMMLDVEYDPTEAPDPSNISEFRRYLEDIADDEIYFMGDDEFRENLFKDGFHIMDDVIGTYRTNRVETSGDLRPAPWERARGNLFLEGRRHSRRPDFWFGAA